MTTTNLNVTELEVYNEIKSLFYDDFRFDDLVQKSKLSLTENQLKGYISTLLKKGLINDARGVKGSEYYDLECYYDYYLSE
jgi:hypothetical protein